MAFGSTQVTITVWPDSAKLIYLPMIDRIQIFQRLDYRLLLLFVVDPTRDNGVEYGRRHSRIEENQSCRSR